MRVLHVTYSDSEGGAAIGAYRLHHAMGHRGIDSHMLVIHKGTTDPNVHRVLGADNRLAFREHAQATRDLKELYGNDDLPIRSLNLIGVDVASIINEHRPDVVQLHWIANNTVRLSDLRRIEAPLVWKMPDMWPFSGGEHYIRHGDIERFRLGYDKTQPHRGEVVDMDLVVWAAKRRFYRDLKLTVTSPSRFLAQCAHDSVLLGAYDVHVIPNPLPWTFISGDPADDEERRMLRGQLGLPIDKTIAMFAAYSTTERRKGFHHIEEMTRSELARFATPEDVAFLVVGAAGGSRDKLNGYDVFVHPTITEPNHYKRFLRASDLLLFPSEMDSTAMVVQEALAQGVPTVAFDVGGMPDMIEHLKNGYLAQPYDPADLAKGFDWWRQSDDKERIRRYAAQRSGAMHQPNVTVFRYLQLYEQVIARATHRQPFTTGRFVDRSVDPAVINRRFHTVIVDPSAVTLDDSSHNAEHVLAFASCFAASHMRTTLLINSNATFENPFGDTVKALPWTIYDDVRAILDRRAPAIFGNARSGTVAGVPSRSWALYEAIVAAGGEKGWAPDDAIVFPTTDRFCVEATLLFLFGHGSSLCPSFHLNIMFEKADFVVGGYPLDLMMHSLKDSGLVDRRVFLYAETARMAHDLQSRFDVMVHHQPPPSLFSPEQMRDIEQSGSLTEQARRSYARSYDLWRRSPAGSPQAAPADPPRIVVPGRGRRDKGWDLLPAIVDEFNRRHGSGAATFVIQKPRAMDGLGSEVRELKKQPNVRLLDSIIPSEALDDLCSSAHIMLLPYSPSVYRNRGSAFAWKAVVNAVPMVVSQNTALSEAMLSCSEELPRMPTGDDTDSVIVHRNGIAATSTSAAAFATALEAVIINREWFRDGAREMRCAYYRHSVVGGSIKHQMRRELYYSARKVLTLSDLNEAEPGDRTELPETEDMETVEQEFVAHLVLGRSGDQSEPLLQWREGRTSIVLAIEDDGTDHALVPEVLPEPYRSALEGLYLKELRAPTSLAVNRGLLRTFPAHWLSTLRLY